MTTPKLPDKFDLASTPVSVTTKVVVGEGDAGTSEKRAFSMEAYTGAIFDVGFGPAVIDLNGLQIPVEGVPIFRQHEPGKFVGRSTLIGINDSSLMIEGELFFGVAEADEVASISDQGGMWQASVGIGIDFEHISLVDQDGHAQVNGRLMPGPFVLLKKTTLRESSFVPIGADQNTSAVALADDADPNHHEGETPKETAMSDDKQRIAELSSAFADNPKFALKAITEGWSLMEAKAHRADELTAELAAQKTAHEADLAAKEAAHAVALAEAKKVVAPKASPAAILSGGDTGDSSTGGCPTSEWERLVATERALLSDLGHNGARRGGGLSFKNTELGRRANLTAYAVQRVAEKNPEAHKAYLAAFNKKGR